MRTGDQRRATEYWLNAPVLGAKRTPSGPFDFGDAATVGLCVKRVGMYFHDFDPNKDFGIFLGVHPGDGGPEWVVGIKDMGMKLVGCEVFASLDELKQVWQLD